MKTRIKEKFEVTLFNPATRFFEGGSWHARVTVDGEISIAEMKMIQDAIDEFDHSTIVPAEFVTLDEVADISKRYTVLRDADTVAQMFEGVSKVIFNKIKDADLDLCTRIETFEFWRDNNDIEYYFVAVDIVDSDVKIIKHEAQD